MALIFQDWYNANEARRYPLHDAATLKSTTGAMLPNDILVDANIWIPRTAGRYIFLSSLSVTPNLVTMTFSATDATPICGTPSGVFIPVAVLNVRRPIVRFKNYPLTPFLEGAGGWVSLGKGAVDVPAALFFSFAGPLDGLLNDRVVRAYYDIPVTKMGKAGITPTLQGLIRLAGAPGSVVTRGAVVNIDGTPRLAGLIGLDLAQNGVTRLQDLAGVCGHRPQARNCIKPAITEINDVQPDCNGNIDLEFEGLAIVGDTGDGMVLDSALGLGEVCEKPFDHFISETDDVCGLHFILQPENQIVFEGSFATFRSLAAGPTTPYYQWAESTDGGATWHSIIGANSPNYTIPVAHLGDNGHLYKVMVSLQQNWTVPGTIISRTATLVVVNTSSSIPVPEPSSMIPGGVDCEYFGPGHPPSELVAIHGEWESRHVSYMVPEYIYDWRAASVPGQPQEECVTLDNVRKMDVNTGFTLTGLIRPKGGEGHLIFGYAGEQNFFMMGVILSHPSYPYGAFFVAQRVTNMNSGASALGLGDPGAKYMLLPGSVLPIIDPLHPLSEADYTFRVNIEKIGSFVVVDWAVDWKDLNNVDYTRGASYPIPIPSIWKSANTQARVGFGSYDSETEFDNFGINCTASSSTVRCGCSEFNSGMESFVPLVGAFEVSGGRLRSGPAASLPGYIAVQSNCLATLYNPGDVYGISAVVKPGAAASARAGVAISVDIGSVIAAPPGNVLLIGVDRLSTPGATHGSFFIEQYINNGLTALLHTQPATVDLTDADYTISVTVERVDDILPTDNGKRVLISVDFAWGAMRTDMSLSVLLNETTSGSVPDSVLRASLLGVYANLAGAEFDHVCITGTAFPCDDTLSFSGGYGDIAFVSGGGSLSGGRLLAGSPMLVERLSCMSSLRGTSTGYRVVSTVRPGASDLGAGIILSGDDLFGRTSP